MPSVPTPNYYAGNFQQGQGNFHEYEASTEVGIPLLNDATFGKADLDIAGRETVYSTSGWVSTWKVGATWDTPVDGFRLRALQSRDVRAPNLAELFGAARVNNGSVNDDFRVNGGAAGQSVSPPAEPDHLQPEPQAGTRCDDGIGRGLFAGLAAGLQRLGDYYRIAVKGEITNYGQQQQMDICYNNGQAPTAGSLAQCGFFYSNVNGVALPW